MENKLLELIKTKRLFLDGGTGTVLQSLGLADTTAPEMWNIQNPDAVIQLHKAYFEAGSNIVSTNTFGVNCEKYQNYSELIKSAVDNAKKARELCKRPNTFIALDIGPTGHLLKPLGDLDFERAVEIFSSTIKEGVKTGVDLILIETMNDSLETKAAVIAAKECCDLPIFVTNVYDSVGKLMTGADAKAMIAMLEGLRVSAIGLNCSLGPDKMLPVIEEFAKYSSLPIIAKPNAGLPTVKDGKTVFDTNEEEFSDSCAVLAKSGACILGGCCGTTPQYIKKLVEKVTHIPYAFPEYKSHTLISSYTHAVQIGQKPLLIGERINPTGKKKLKEALRENDMSYILSEAIKQVEKGVHILDVNVGLPEIDEEVMMQRAVYEIQAVTDTVLQLDSSNPAVLEKAMRIYNGKPLINSVNGKEESMRAIFPLIQKYGGTLIALTLDEDGIPQTAQKRADVAKKIIDTARMYGIDKKDIIADPLALTVSSDSSSALVTLQAIKLIRKMGIYTSLGVSNISFGLPLREKINSAFFTMALQSGLNLAIMNPFSTGMTDAYFAFLALYGYDKVCSDYIGYAQSFDTTDVSSNSLSQTSADAYDLSSLIINGLREKAKSEAQRLINCDENPLDIINSKIIPALNKIGSDFEAGRAFLPQLLMSAEAASASFEVIKEKLVKKQSESDKAVILATVKGDIHDIGKNIVKVLLESYGYKVYDLGRDVDSTLILETAKKTGCRLVGLSALMTTTVPAMQETIHLLKSQLPQCKIMVGGAVLTQEYAKKINADFYAKDGMDGVKIAEKFYREDC
ncbi:MAG: homocysteine S-methyltransferase family protein [Clostridia bacterium]|nr:homocysteine S-methyltransferase family protein [Clostridia bacterium]